MWRAAAKSLAAKSATPVAPLLLEPCLAQSGVWLGKHMRDAGHQGTRQAQLPMSLLRGFETWNCTRRPIKPGVSLTQSGHQHGAAPTAQPSLCTLLRTLCPQQPHVAGTCSEVLHRLLRIESRLPLYS